MSTAAPGFSVTKCPDNTTANEKKVTNVYLRLWNGSVGLSRYQTWSVFVLALLGLVAPSSPAGATVSSELSFQNLESSNSSSPMPMRKE